MKRRAGNATLKRKLISVAVASCFAGGIAHANPTAPTVVHGAATFQQAGNLLAITNSPGTIINWGSFSISASEVTRFIQQSSASTVLNRVVGQDPSSILGALQSNGRVFLINPNGILFGAGAQVDVAGLVASTLNLSNADFLAGRLNFTEVPGAGSVVNQGSITTGQGGQVYLVAPDVTNSGIITSPQGEVVLAAGKSVELVNPGTPNLRVEVNAPDNAARNLGQIVAESGRVGIYAGLIDQSGTIRADSAVATADGRIVLKATQNATLGADSVTTANGPNGGRIEIQSGDTTLVSGTVEAKGAAGQGGTVHVLGNLVGLTGNARIDASGETGGGEVLVGGDFQGNNPDIQNAYRAYVGPDTRINADAITGGNGGKVIVWSDDATRAYGTISARGGAQSGDGGFVEVSGKRWLDFDAKVDTRAPAGRAGTLLLDPNNVEIVDGVDSLDGGSFSGGDPNIFSNGVDGNSQISWDTIAINLDSAAVYITTEGDSGGSADITVSGNSPILNASNTLRLISHGDVIVNGTIRNDGAGALEMYAGWDGLSALTPAITSSGSVNINQAINIAGNLVMHAGGSILQSGVGIITANQVMARAGDTVDLTLPNMVNVVAGEVYNCCGTQFNFTNAKALTIGSVAGTNGITASDGDGTPQINVNVTSGTLTIDQPVTANDGGSIALTAAGAVNVNSNVLAVSGDGPISITGGSIAVGSGATISALSPFGGPVVSLTATSGDISIQDGALIEAGFNAASSNGASVSLSATGGDITAGNATITATGGSQAFTPGGPASVTMSATGGISLSGSTVTATAGGGSDSMGGGAQADVILGAGGTIDLTGSTLTATGGANGLGAPGVGWVSLEVSTASGNASASGDIVAHNIVADNVNLQQNSLGTPGRSILRAAGNSLIEANQILLEIDHLGTTVSGGSIGTSAEPMRIQANRLEAHTHEASSGIFIESPNAGDLQIGGVDFFSGSVKGVQNVTSGFITLKVNGALTTQAGTAVCGTGGGTGGPICTGGLSTIQLVADSMTFGNVVSNTGTPGAAVVLQPFTTSRDINIEATPTAGTLSLSAASLQQVTADQIAIGDGFDSGAYTGTLTVSEGFNTAASRLVLALGDIALNAPIDTGGGTLTLRAPGTVTQTAALSAQALELLGAGGTHTLTNASNAVSVLAADTGSVSFINVSDFSIGTAGITSGIAVSGDVVLSTSGTVTQSQPISATGLALTGIGGGYVLNHAGNSVGTLAANTGGVQYSNNGSFTVGMVGATSGFNVTGDAKLTATGGDLNIAAVNVTGPDVFLAAGGAITQDTGSAITGTSLSATAATGISLAGSNQVSSFSATNTTSGNIEFNNVSSALVLNGISAAGGGNFTLTNTGGAISQTDVVTVSGDTTITAGANSITLNGSNDFVGTIFIANSGVNGTHLVDINGLTLGTSTFGSGGALFTAGSTIMVAGAITSEGSVFLTANGALSDINIGPAATINTTGLADVRLNAGRDVLLRGTFGASGGNQSILLNPAGVVRTAAGSTLTLNGGVAGITAEVENGKTWQNDGTITLLGNSSIRLPNEGGYATFSNAGTLDIDSTAGWSFLSDSSVQGGIVHNAGTINVNESTSWEAAFANATGGTLNIAAGKSLSLQNGQAIAGTVDLGAGSTLWVSERHGTNAAFNATTITGTGTLQVAAGLGPVADLTDVNAGTAILGIGNGGTVNVLTGTSTFGSLAMTGGTLSGPGTLIINSSLTQTGGNQTGTGSTVLGPLATAALGGVTVNRALTNEGILQLNGTTLNGQLTNTGEIDVIGSASASGGLTHQAGNVDVTGGQTFTVGGSGFDWQGGTISGAGGFALPPGSVFKVTTTYDVAAPGPTIAASDMDILPGGILTGTGTVNGNVNNSGGVVSPGNSPGILTISGNYTQGPSGTLSIEIGGTAAGTQYDQLVVGGNVALDGTLSTTYISGFVPASSDTFNIIQAGGTVSGTFATTSFTPVTPLPLTYAAADVTLGPLVAAPTLPPTTVVETPVTEVLRIPATTEPNQITQELEQALIAATNGEKEDAPPLCR